MKRTKEEIKMARDLICLYFGKFGNNPHLAFSIMIETHLTMNRELPYFIDGLEEFIKVSKTLTKKEIKTWEIQVLQ